MARKGKRPIFDINSFPPETQNRINRMLDPKDGGATGISDAELKRYIYSDSSGLMNSTPIEPRVNFIAGQGDTTIGPTGDCQIVFGRDRPASLPSGYGGDGATGANAMDIVVGRVSSANPKDGTAASPNIGGDAARIYISQLTDIDLNFGLAPGQSGELTGVSGIGIKADGVRIIGRRGVKIVTGRSFSFKGVGLDGETDSRGNPIKNPAPPIELIAGNYDQPSPSKKTVGIQQVNSLQGVAKGENVSDALGELSQVVEELQGAVFNIALLQTIYNATNSVDYFRPWMANVGARTSQEFINRIINSIWHSRINNILWQVNYTKPYGRKWVASRNVFST